MKAVAEQYVKSLGNADLEDESKEIDADEWSIPAGYDIHQEGAWERALEAWKPHLPRQMRSWTTEDFAAHMGAGAVPTSLSRP